MNLRRLLSVFCLLETLSCSAPTVRTETPLRSAEQARLHRFEAGVRSARQCPEENALARCPWTRSERTAPMGVCASRQPTQTCVLDPTLAGTLPQEGAQHDQWATSSYVLSVGSAYVPPLEGVLCDCRYSDESVVLIRVSPEGDRFLPVAQRPGRTFVLLRFTDGRETRLRVVVRRVPSEVVRTQLTEMLRGMPDVRVCALCDQRFVLAGTVSTVAQLRQISQLVAVYLGIVEAQVTLGEGNSSE